MEVLNNICLDIVDCEHKTAPIQNEGIPSIRTTDIKNGFLDFKGSNKVSEETYQKWTQRLEPKAYDIILAREAPVGQVGILPKGQRVCLGQRTVLIRPNKQKVYPFYLLYLLLSREIQHKMKVRASGSTVEHLNMSDIRNLQLPDLPSLKIQKEIGDTLGNLDAKIENLRRQNETLEAIAQTLFKHWFIDFEFPNADGKPYKSSGGAMIPSELGEIPEGWRVGTLKECLEHLVDNRGKTPVFLTSGIPALSAKFVKKGEIVNKDNLNYISFDLFDKSEKLKIGDVIMTSEAPLGETYFIAQNTQYYPAQRVFALRANDEIISPSYLNYWLTSSIGQSLVQRRASGSTVQGIKQSELYKCEIIIPDKEINNKASKLFMTILLKKELNSDNIQTLAKTRDALLPKLMSGQIRVKE